MACSATASVSYLLELIPLLLVVPPEEIREISCFLKHLQLPVEATIRELSDKVADLTGVPVSGQKLIFCGKQLSKDPSSPLAEVRIFSA